MHTCRKYVYIFRISALSFAVRRVPLSSVGFCHCLSYLLTYMRSLHSITVYEPVCNIKNRVTVVVRISPVVKINVLPGILR